MENNQGNSEYVPAAIKGDCFNPNVILPCGLTTEFVHAAMQDFTDLLTFINANLVSRGIEPLERLLMQANFSSLVGEFIAASIPKRCPKVVRNRYHNGYPDLIPQGVFPKDSVQHGNQGLEIKASRYDKGWQGHNAEQGWLMVFVFAASRPPNASGGNVIVPFEYKAVYAAELIKTDWTFSGRKGESRRTITASVNRSGFGKMSANWVYKTDCAREQTNGSSQT